MTWSKAIDFYALSWGIPRMPACNLVETTQRKSQTYEASLCQETHASLERFFALFSAFQVLA